MEWRIIDKMAPSKYLTAPIPSEKIPQGIPYIVSNEAAERFSFYGNNCILVIFMTTYLMGEGGRLAVMTDENAKACFHWFVSAVYFFPILGALLSDIFLGKYRTIISLSLVYCLGHLALALNDTHLGLLLGLGMIAIGSGGIKPCVSATVGDQFGQTNQHLLEKVYGWFYFAINLGAFASTILTPWILNKYGPHWAFGVPGILMGLATLIFWLGRKKYVHIPPGGIAFVKECFSGEGLRAIGKLSIIYFFGVVFWALYNQTASAWVLQAKHMDRHIWKFELLPSQIQAINPLLIMLMIPLFTEIIYPALNRLFTLTALRKIALGFFVTALAFMVSAGIELRIEAGSTPTIAWQLLAYIIITAAEVMVSITFLEFSYTQAPKKMKSFIMSIFLLSISLGNAVTALVNEIIQNPDGTSKLSGAHYYWFFAAMMLITAVVFIFVARTYQVKNYLQDEG